MATGVPSDVRGTAHGTRCDEGLELLHKVRGSVEVASSMIERSTGLCVRSELTGDDLVLAGLSDAADALSFVAEALEAELRKHTPSRSGSVAAGYGSNR